MKLLLNCPEHSLPDFWWFSRQRYNIQAALLPQSICNNLCLSLLLTRHTATNSPSSSARRLKGTCHCRRHCPTICVWVRRVRSRSVREGQHLSIDAFSTPLRPYSPCRLQAALRLASANIHALADPPSERSNPLSSGQLQPTRLVSAEPPSLAHLESELAPAKLTQSYPSSPSHSPSLIKSPSHHLGPLRIYFLLTSASSTLCSSTSILIQNGICSLCCPVFEPSCLFLACWPGHSTVRSPLCPPIRRRLCKAYADRVCCPTGKSSPRPLRRKSTIFY